MEYISFELLSVYSIPSFFLFNRPIVVVRFVGKGFFNFHSLPSNEKIIRKRGSNNCFQCDKSDGIIRINIISFSIN